MVFSSAVFLFGFLPALLALYFLAKDKYKNYVLLLFSLIFYGFGGPKLLVMMIGFQSAFVLVNPTVESVGFNA